jgi:hypothetical protein
MPEFNGSVPLATLVGAWNAFFFAPESPATMALFRIAFGLLLLVDAAFHASDARFMFGPDGVLNHRIWMRDFSKRMFSVFRFLPGTMGSVRLVLTLHIIAAFGILLGIVTPVCAVLAFFTLLSLQHRNPFILNSGDVALRLMCFCFMFVPQADNLLSVDAWMRGGPDTTPVAPWGHRLMQILIAIIYFKSMYWKLLGPWWRDGTAVFYVLNIRRYQRATLPVTLHHVALFKAITWATMVIWGSLGILIWVDELRYPVMAIGVLFHLGMDAMLRIRLFQWVMMTGLVLFIKPQDAESILRGLGLI